MISPKLFQNLEKKNVCTKKKLRVLGGVFLWLKLNVKESRKIERSQRKEGKTEKNLLKSARQSLPQPLLTLWKNKKQG